MVRNVYFTFKSQRILILDLKKVICGDHEVKTNAYVNHRGLDDEPMETSDQEDLFIQVIQI